ncbi:MAG: ankyrin repeat domain-containing protein [Pseudomonadales bacterium]
MQYTSQILRGFRRAFVTILLTTAVPQAAAETSAEQIRQALLRQDAVSLSNVLAQSEFDANALVFSQSWRAEQMAAIHLAAESGDVSLANILLKHGASNTIKTSLGNSALHIASKNGHREFVEFLASAGVDLNLLNQAGKSALILAREQGHQDIVALLTRAGALDSEATAHSDDKILGSRQVIYEPLERTFQQFGMNATGDRLVAVDSRGLLTVHNPKSGVFLEQLQLDPSPLGLVAQNDRLILTYPDKVEFRTWANLLENETHSLQARPTAISAVPGSPHLYYSDGEVVYRLDTGTGDSTEVHRQWGINQLDVVADGKTLFVSTDFAITVIDTQSYEAKGTYNGYNRARYLLDGQLIVLRGDVASSQEQGVSYVAIDHQAAVVKEFSIPRTFQQQDVRITRFQDQQILTESFNQVALSDQSGQSFMLSFNEFKFEDFAFHPEVGFVLFNPSEIQLFSTSGVVNTRLVANTNFKPLRSESERRKLSFIVKDGAIDVHNKRGKKKTLSSASAVTSLVATDKYLAAGHLDGSYSIWRLPSLKLLEQKPYLTGKVSSIYIDEERERVYLGGLGRVAATGFGKGSHDTVNIMLRGHDNFVTALALSEGGDLLISSGDDGTVKFWDVADHRLVQNLAFSGGWLDSIEVTSDLAVTGRGPGIASFSLDAADLYGEMTDPAPRVTVQKANTSQVNKVIVDPTGRFSANNDGASVNIRDIKSGMLQTRIFPKAGSTNDFAFTHDGNSLVLVSGEHMEFWDPASGLLQKQVNHGFTGGAFHSINAIPDINLFLAANTWGWHEPFYIHANSGERRGVWNYLQQVNMQGDGPVDIAISADGEHLAVYGHKRIHLFKSHEQSYVLVNSIPRAKPDITNQYFRDYIGFRADGKYLHYLSFAGDNEVVVWDVESQSETLRKPGKLAVFLNDHKLLYMSDNVSLSILDIDTGETELVSRFEHNDLISSLSYNANEATFTSADIWGNTITWDARSYQKIRSLDRFDNDVYTSELSSDGRFLAYNNKQGIHLLDLQNMNLLSLDGNNYPYFGAFTNDAAKFYYRNGSEYHYIDLTSPQLTEYFAFDTTWHPETTKGTEISIDDRYLMFVSEETYHIYDLEQGIQVKQLAKQGMFADKTIFSFMSFDPAQQRITGQLVSSPKPGFAQTQLVHYQYDQGVAEHLSDPVTFDMSDEIKQFTASKDLKVNLLSPSGRYYAYSQDRYLKLIDLNTNQQIFNARKSELEYLVFDAKEQFLLLVDETGYLEKVSLKDQSIVARYKTTEAKVTSVKTAGEFVSLLGEMGHPRI